MIHALKDSFETLSASKESFMAFGPGISVGLIMGTPFRALYRTVCDIHRIGGTLGLKCAQEVS